MKRIKSKRFAASQPSPLQDQQPGFALIATISVMVLMVMIALAMLSLSTIELRSSGNTRHQQQAQANARMALMIAIGELQKYAGPDTRVTVNASQANGSSPNPYWVAVYKTRPDEELSASTPVSGTFVVDHHSDPLYLTDNRTNGSGAYTRPTPIAHLVSGQDINPPSTLLNDTNSIKILDTGDVATTVRAPLVKSENARYAYWVSDSSMKALYNHANPHSKTGNNDPSASNEEYFGAAIVQAPHLDELDIDGSKPLAGHGDLEVDQLSKSISLGSSRILFSSVTPEQVKKAFHTMTSDSAAVFSNTMTGGLKFDLTAFIESGDMSPSGDDANKNLPSLALDTPIIKGDHHNMTSPRFGILKDWADMRFKLDNSSGQASIPPQVSNDSFHQTFARSMSLKRRDLTKVKTNYMQPVVVEASLGWDVSPYTAGTLIKTKVHILPRLTLWNPYNVTLTSAKYVFLAKRPANLYFNFSNYKTGEGRKGDQIRASTLNWLNLNSAGLSNTQRDFLGFTTGTITLEPGETKVFSPGSAQIYDPKNLGANILSSAAPKGTHYFFVKSQYPKDDKFFPPEVIDKPYRLGQVYSLADEYVVLQALSSGAINHSKLESDNYETIAHFLAQNANENKDNKWYDGGWSGSLNFSESGTWDPARLSPRNWRRGIRLQWYDESAEVAASGHYTRNKSRLTTPLLATANLHSGTFNHPNALDVRVQEGWQLPHFSGHLFFRQPTDPQELTVIFPPSPIGRPGTGYPDTVVLFDVPRENPGIFSLGQFQHAQFSYLPWHPSFILGASYSTRHSDLDATALRDSSKQTSGVPAFLVSDGSRWRQQLKVPGHQWGRAINKADNILQSASSDSGQKHGDEVLIYDISFELNHAFWDSYMLSGIPYQGGVGSRSISWDGITPLPVSGYRPHNAINLPASKFVSETTSNPQFPFYHSAELLLNHGALNVNCDNKEVWKSYLLGLQGVDHPNLANTASAGGEVNMSRSLLPAESGSTSITGGSDTIAWNGFRTLSVVEIDSLATEIVSEVRTRGPFLSLSDFINRRLNTDDTQNYEGALQASINRAGINAGLKQGNGSNLAEDKTSEVTTDLKTITNRVDFKTAGLPGFFSQNDLLTALSPSLTARGDTFTIRAYGESRDKSGNKILARAYCEATVQRTPEYVDSSDDALEPIRVYNESSNTWTLNESSGTGDQGLSKTNIKFGRKFKITKFRWLSTKEI